MKRMLIVIMIVIGMSCDSELTINPSASLTPEQVLNDPDNIESMLIGAYATGSQWLRGEFQAASELLANEGDLLYLGTFVEFLEFDTKQMTSASFTIRFLWIESYRAINLCNLILDNLDVIADPDQRNRIEGGAKYLRGLLYFELVRFYALPYESGINNSQLGLPLVLEGVIDASELTYPNRVSVEEIYQQSIIDLIDAASLLPLENDVIADNYAARALMARIYHQQGNYAAARDASHDVIVNSGHVLAPGLESAFNNEEDGIEDVFMWQVTTQDGENWFNEYWATREFGGRSSTADISILDPFFDSFQGTDDRAEYFYAGNGTTVSSKWINEFANIPYIRVAEMHLIRAESNFRLGSSLGLDPEMEINTLRARSNAAAINGLSLQDILDERKRELAFEGFALHEAKRLKQQIAGMPYNDNLLVMPIPQQELDVNPNLEPNPGYSN